jgi:hypothetical protein
MMRLMMKVDFDDMTLFESLFDRDHGINQRFGYDEALPGKYISMAHLTGRLCCCWSGQTYRRKREEDNNRTNPAANGNGCLCSVCRTLE